MSARKYNQQESSRLAQLPAELRTMILRRLLKHDGPIQTKTDLGARGYHDTTQLSAQLLGTCQLLYREGTQILYDENTALINIHHRFLNLGGRLPETILSCDVLNAHFRLPGTIEAIRSTNPVLLHYLKQHSQSQPNRQHKAEATHALSVYPLLERFQRLKIKVEYHDRQDIFIITNLLKDLLIDKHVLIDDKIVNTPPNDPMVIAATGQAALRQWSFIRCKSVKFEQWPEMVEPNRLITGRSNVTYIWPYYFNLMAGQIGRVPAKDIPGQIRVTFKSTQSLLVEEIKNAMMDTNSVAFITLRQRILERASQWTKDWAARNRQYLQEEYERTNAQENETNKILAGDGNPNHQ